MDNATTKNNYFLVTFKKGLGKPTYVYALDYDAAKKEGLAYFKKNSGYADSVDLYSTVENTIESVKLVEV